MIQCAAIWKASTSPSSIDRVSSTQPLKYTKYAAYSCIHRMARPAVQPGMVHAVPVRARKADDRPGQQRQSRRIHYSPRRRQPNRRSVHGQQQDGKQYADVRRLIDPVCRPLPTLERCKPGSAYNRLLIQPRQQPEPQQEKRQQQEKNRSASSFLPCARKRPAACAAGLAFSVILRPRSGRSRLPRAYIQQHEYCRYPRCGRSRTDDRAGSSAGSLRPRSWA